MGPDVARPRRRSLERRRRLRPQRVAIVVGGEPDGLEIVAGDDAGELVAALRAEDPGRGEMAGQPLPRDSRP